MTKSTRLEMLVWTFAIGTALGSIPTWMHPISDGRSEIDFALQQVQPSQSIDAGAIHQSATVLRDRNPFRLERRPTSVRFGSLESELAPEDVQVHVDRPRLTLAGIVGGPPWMVLVEGIPGRESGAVLIQGEEINGFRLEHVHGDTAVLIGIDTTWVLLPKQVWR